MRPNSSGIGGLVAGTMIGSFASSIGPYQTDHHIGAHGYLRGNSERVIGEVGESVGNRDKVFIATKMYFARDRERNVFSSQGTGRNPGATEENLFRQLETSLERLRTDYVDILYLHSCYSPEMVTFEPMMNALVKAKKQGKVRFIGVSTHSNEPDVIRSTVDAGVYDVALTAYNSGDTLAWSAVAWLAEGEVCAADSECNSGLLCCYPCGVPGCEYECAVPVGDACPVNP